MEGSRTDFFLNDDTDNNISKLAEEIMEDRERDFWMRETGTDQQVARFHERLMMMMNTCDKRQS